MLKSQVSNPLPSGSCMRIFLVFLKLGLTAFGGPVAHIAFFRDEFVTRRQWYTEQHYAQLVALCQFLPGPASSQVGFAIGLQRGGPWGALAAWLGFTLPSALVLIALALSLQAFSVSDLSGVIAGLKIVAFAVVAQAVWGMAQSLCPTTKPRVFAVLACICVYFMPALWVQMLVLQLAALAGLMVFKPAKRFVNTAVTPHKKSGGSVYCLVAFASLLLGLPMAIVLFNGQWPQPILEVVQVFYSAGALVFGGGHVVLPLLQTELVGNLGVSNDTFMAGYGLTQAMPGPLFTFAAFLGASLPPVIDGALGGPPVIDGGIVLPVLLAMLMAVLCLVVIFLPGFLLLLGVLPFWGRLQNSTRFTAALAGVNAAVVGFLLAALLGPIAQSALLSWPAFVLAGAAMLYVFYGKAPVWLLVLLCALAGYVFL